VQAPARMTYDTATGRKHVLLTRMATLANLRPRAILLTAFMVLICAAAFGAQVTRFLPAGGYDDPSSESAKANRILTDEFGITGMTIAFQIASSTGVDSAPALKAAKRVGNALKASPFINSVQSYWSNHSQAQLLRSKDGRSGLIVAQVAGDDSDAPRRAQTVADGVDGDYGDGVSVSAGGLAIAYSQSNLQSAKDLERAEMIAMPITAIILIWAFGNLVAATIPLAVAVFAIACTNAALRALNNFTDVSVLAVSLATPLCLALAIDYSMFIVGRYREEVSRGVLRDRALTRTMNTAGRTVIFSAATVGLSLAAMAVFPMYFLRSLAYGGLIGVAMSSVGALVVAPALIVVIGGRIDSRKLLSFLPAKWRSPVETAPSAESSNWYRLARFVMRHAVAFSIALIALLIGLGLPISQMKFAYPDDRVLPATATARQVGDDIRDEYPRNSTATVSVIVPDRGSLSDAQLSSYAAALSTVPNVLDVSGATGVFINGRRVQTATRAEAFTSNNSVYFSISTHADPTSAPAREQLSALKRIHSPVSVYFTGMAQESHDNAASIVSRIPAVLILIALSTFALIFLLTNSVLLPIKALVMNTLSLTAAFGAIVWIFQEGHLGGLGTSTFGYLPAQIPPLIFCAAFGLSMDYEVFVLSRIREEWNKSSRSRAGNGRAIAVGLSRCGPIVTTAAFIMAVVFAALMTAEVSFVRMLGFGLAVTVSVDAFLVRGLLVPAVMHLAGRANWWAPAILRRFQIGHDDPSDHLPDCPNGACSTELVDESAESAGRVSRRTSSADEPRGLDPV
jgi:putative drug exporter of the RND superfamily